MENDVYYLIRNQAKKSVEGGLFCLVYDSVSYKKNRPGY
jgi:hypothetical protein